MLFPEEQCCFWREHGFGDIWGFKSFFHTYSAYDVDTLFQPSSLDVCV